MKRIPKITSVLWLLPICAVALPLREVKKEKHSLIEKFKAIPDSLFRAVHQENLLREDTYVKLARDGWSQQEIKPVMSDYFSRNRSMHVGSNEFGRYAKQWLPSASYTPGGDTLYEYVDTTYEATMYASVRKALGRTSDPYYFAEPYTPDDRKAGRRQPGVFRPVLHNPSAGRIHWMHMHPENDDSILCIPDGAGLFKTHDAGRTWDCITDRIPVREHRNVATHSAIPVDPDNWNHLYAFMDNGNPVYQTLDGGETWRRIEGATHHRFKRGYCFRDAAGKLKFIGAVQRGQDNYWGSKLYISEDTCKTWTEVILPDSLKDIRPYNGVKGAWFQQVEFDPTNRDMIYLPTSKSIFYFDDGARAYEENGKRVYRIKKMNLRIHGEDKTTLRSDTTVVPFPGTSQGFLNIDPNNPNKMWYACADRGGTNHTALFYSEDKGASWITLKDQSVGIGSGPMFGNETPWGWLGGFGVNFRDPNWVYGCSMSSAISSDGGKNWSEFAWGHRMQSLHDDGNYYHVTNARHNADNHAIVSHKSGRVLRASDAGLLMRDLDVFGNQWHNISNFMGQMLYYGVRVNEFGDQMITGNTQDIDVQTYRYGRWGHWRGYEGSGIMTNPYSNTVYYPSGGDGLEDCTVSSWQPGWGYADVVTGNWYALRQNFGKKKTLMRVEDVGRSGTWILMPGDLDVKDIALARDKNRTSLFVIDTGGNVRVSYDHGETFELLLAPSNTQAIAADPNNSDYIYLAKRGVVIKHHLPTGEQETIGTGLPNIDCNRILHHEGSGDLYFVNNSIGIFLKKPTDTAWSLWMTGYNTTKLKDAQINYTTQEMVVADYGRGVYVADLETPADRYFDEGFALKELSHRNNQRTLGIDTEWTIPLYYNYRWWVNDVEQTNPYQYFTANLQAGDRVQLELTLRESPDVTTRSAAYVVTETPNVAIEPSATRALYSDGSGGVDLGYVDYFFNDFSVELWVKPETEGVILANRQRDYDRGAKGWVLQMRDKQLQFVYSPANMLNQPTYETPESQQLVVRGGSMKLNQWQHVAITQDRDGQITLYLDGVQQSAGERIRIDHTLNNAMNLTALADGYERAMMRGAIDEIKIWRDVLTQEQVRLATFSHQALPADRMIYYQGFDNPVLPQSAEAFSGKSPMIRKRAQVKLDRSPIAAGAKLAVTRAVSQQTVYQQEGVNLLTLQTSQPFTPTLFAYQQGQTTEEPSNLDPRYYDIAPWVFQLRTFEGEKPDSVTLAFHVDGLDASKQYRLYVASAMEKRAFWTRHQDLTVDAAAGVAQAPAMDYDELEGKLLLVTTLNPSIETNLRGMNTAGTREIYSPADLQLWLDAQIVDPLPEPLDGYRVKSQQEGLAQVEELFFTQGKAKAQIYVSGDSLGAFNQVTPLRLVGEDEQMIPLAVKLINRMVPQEVGQSVAIVRNGISVGTASEYQAIHQSNTVTMMTWVRIDSADILTGLKPLMMFRGGGVATGIHLQNGNIRCHWNEEGWSWGTATNLNITNDDLGRWMHVALVASPTSMDYYLNGVLYRVNRNINKGRIHAGLMLGINWGGERTFAGAFDQVAIWNRSLTQEEVIHAMHHAVSLQDSALVTYLNMDYKNAEGRLVESNQGMTVGYSTEANVQIGHRSPFPFQPEQVGMTAEQGYRVILPAGSEVETFWQQFRGLPYNYLSPTRQSYRPLQPRYFTLTSLQKPEMQPTDSMVIEMRDVALLAGEEISLGVRPSGSETPFEQFFPTRVTQAGEMTVKVPAALLHTPQELLLFVAPDAAERPIIGDVKASLGEQALGNQLILSDRDSIIAIDVEMTSYNLSDQVLLHVREDYYATLDCDTIALNQFGKSRHYLHLDRTQMQALGWNPITLSLVGAEGDPLELQVSFEPRVELTLQNGLDANTIVAEGRTVTLDVQAELVQGVLTEEVKMEVTSDLNHAQFVGIGSLLSDEEVRMDSLLHFESPYGAQHEGWNLIGSPYLGNINLTKAQNVQIDSMLMTPFIYRYHAATGNYWVDNMTEYDLTSQIKPFEAYFVKSRAQDAYVTVTPTAKERTHTRKTFDYYEAGEKQAIRLELLQGDQVIDRTQVEWREGAASEYVEEEDAPKLWGMNTAHNELFSNVALVDYAINTVPKTQLDVNVGLRIGTAGEMTLRVANLYGFEQQNLFLTDSATGIEHALSVGDTISFEATQTGWLKGRFTLHVEAIENDLEQTHRYPIYVKDGVCRIQELRGNAHIRIFDVMGRVQVDEVCRENRYAVELPKGSYGVTIEENNQTYTTKIIVR